MYFLLACLLFGCQFIVAEKEPVDVESVEPDVPSVVSKTWHETLYQGQQFDQFFSFAARQFLQG
jgi:hypothetical protein